MLKQIELNLKIFLADVIELSNCSTKLYPKRDRSNSIFRVIGTGHFRRHSSQTPTSTATSSTQNPSIVKIGEATALPVILCGLLDNRWDLRRQQLLQQQQQQPQQSDDDDMIKGNDEFVDDYDQLHDVRTENQPHYHLTYHSLNDKLREKLTPLFNRKHYSSLPQNPPSSTSDFDKSRKNSDNYSAY